MTNLPVLAVSERFRVHVERLDLEHLLDEMSRFGKPRLSKPDTGWYCKVEFFITGAGREFNVDSEFGHPSHVSAARQCLARMLEALDDLGVDPKKLHG